jgi:aminopeptidase N
LSSIEEFFRCRAAAAESALGDGRFALSGARPHYAPDRSFDTEHIRLELSVDIARKTLKGVVRTRLVALADTAYEMVFDAVDFKDLKVTANGKALRFDYDRRKLTVHLAKPVARDGSVEVDIYYRVTEPKLGLHFIGPDRAYPNKPVQVWTQGEDEYNHFWFPCHDAPQERTTTEMIVTVPEKFTAISNGGLLSHRAGKSRTRVFHYKHDVPHSPYLVSLVAGEFTKIEDHWKHIPVLYYCTPGHEEDAIRSFGKTPKMIEFFSSKLKVPYAYAKYSQVAAVDFIYGGMENTSATTQTSMTLHDERAHLDFSSDQLVAHELAHQWFGDLVTCKDWSHAWLNESFATYFEALFREHDLGLDEFTYELHGNAQAYFDEDRERYRRPMVTRTYKNTNDLFDRHLYEKGSLILHMIRRQLGDEAWWRSIHTYLMRHKTKGVETVDLIQAIQDATGKNMRPFFDQWIYKAGHPDYKVRSWWDARAKKIFIRVLQTQATNDEVGLFSMPVTFAFHWSGREQKRVTETVSKKEQLFSYALPTVPEITLFDPDHTILKRVDFVKPEPMWILQLSQDPNILGRLDAAQALGAVASPTAVHALRQALFKEKFWGTQVEIARALGQTGNPTALEALLEGLRQIEHPKARRAIYEALGHFQNARVVEDIRGRLSTEKSYFAEAEAIRTLGRMKDPSLLSLFKDVLKRDSWNDILRCAALEAIGALQLAESVSILKEYSRYGHHPNTRMTAIRRLGLLGRGRDDVQTHLVELLKDSYLLVQLAVVRALGSFADERVTEALMKYSSGDLDGRLKRTVEEAVRRIRKGMESEFPAPKKEKK